eukprot:2301650-Pyramimonas_sp.AAC.1
MASTPNVDISNAFIHKMKRLNLMYPLLVNCNPHASMIVCVPTSHKCMSLACSPELVSDSAPRLIEGREVPLKGR